MKKESILKTSTYLLGLILLMSAGVGISQSVTNDVNSSTMQVVDPTEDMVPSYTTHPPISVTTDSQWDLHSFPGNGSVEDPYVIAYYNITSAGPCIHIQDTSAHFIIHDCLLAGGATGNGIELIYADNGIIQNNTISQKMYGVYMDHAENIEVFNNTFVNNDLSGVFVYQASNHNRVINNTVSSTSGVGVYLTQSSADNIVANNTITGSGSNGVMCFAALDNDIVDNIITGQTQNGLVIMGSPNNTVARNFIYDNSYGIMVDGDGNQILNNTIDRNEYGMLVHSTSDDNLISLNEFILNENYNANDDGDSNHWNSSIWGNYWSDYGGTGVYNIPGGGGAIDYHPFIYDTAIPTIGQLTGMIYTKGTTGHNISLTASDDHPSHFVVIRNNSQISSESWDGSVITVNIDGLDEGIYNYTIVVYDTFGNSASSSALVYVLSNLVTDLSTTTDDGPSLPDTTTLILIGASVVGAIIVIIVLKKIRK